MIDVVKANKIWPCYIRPIILRGYGEVGVNPFNSPIEVYIANYEWGKYLAAAAIFTFRISWNEFILALVLTNRMTRTLPVATTIYLTDTGIEWGNITAMGTLVALPAIIFTFLAAKQLISGLTAGAVKG